MRPPSELIDTEDPGWPVVQQWLEDAVRPVWELRRSDRHAELLWKTQVTNRSPMGAVVYETGGILIDHGWVRVLGSGNPRLTRTLPEWNEGRSDGFYLVADDAGGGFFALNGGALGPDVKNLYYFAPDTLQWEPLEMGYSEFLCWVCSPSLDRFYDWIRLPGWESEVATLSGDRTWTYWPPLWTREREGGRGDRCDIPAEEAWAWQMEMRRQIGPPP